MSRVTRYPVLLLALAVVAGYWAPALTVRGVFPCMNPADCAAMHDLCDMKGLTSHDSCCHVSPPGDVSSLPATLGSSAGPEYPLAIIGSVIPVALPAGATGFKLVPPPGISPRSSPASIAVLRI
ncbi:MAG TPA: hypothetical protein VJX29_12515 [Candidatus Acidoferrales bacterium]|nr:hypothetical protein [Candidatus Acidoferrales bacterium]